MLTPFIITAGTLRKFFEKTGIDLTKGIPQEKYSDVGFYQSLLEAQYGLQRAGEIIDGSTLPQIRDQVLVCSLGRTEAQLMEVAKALTGGGESDSAATKSANN